MAKATTVTQILVGGFINGIAYGIFGMVCMFFIVEYCEVSNRGSLNTFATFGYSLGILVSFTMGWQCSYSTINYSTVTLATCFLILTLWLKETPVYLLRKGKEKEALLSLKFYRGVRSNNPTPKEVSEEFMELKKQINKHSDFNQPVPAEKEVLKGESKNQEKETNSWKLLLTTKSYRTALVIISLHVLLMVLMGTLAVQTYASQFFIRAVPNISPHLCSVALALVFATASGVSMLISDHVGRRPLTIITSGISSMLLVVLSSLLRWSWAPEWVIPLVILLFSFVFQLGPACVTIVQMSECFMPEVKSISMTIAMCFLWIGNFIILYSFPPLVEAIGLDAMFLIFAIFGFILTLSASFTMKETKGVSLIEINRMFQKGYFCRYPNKS